MRALPALAAAALAVLPACATPRSVEGAVALGRTARVGGPHVRPDRVVEDSRCPASTQCLWAGRVVVRATVTGGNWSRVMDLPLGTPVPVADGLLTLVSVTPGRAVPRAPDPRAYRFGFTFGGGL